MDRRFYKKQLEKERKAHEIEKKNMLIVIKGHCKDFVEEKLQRAKDQFGREIVNILLNHDKTAKVLEEKERKILKLEKKLMNLERLIVCLSTYIKMNRLYRKQKRIQKIKYSQYAFDYEENEAKENNDDTVRQTEEDTKEEEENSEDDFVTSTKDDTILNENVHFYGDYLSLTVNDKLLVCEGELMKKYRLENSNLKKLVKDKKDQNSHFAKICEKIMKNTDESDENLESLKEKNDYYEKLLEEQQKGYADKSEEIKNTLYQRYFKIENE